MNYRDFFKKTADIRGLLLFSGEEEYAKQQALKALRESRLPPGMEALNETVFEGAVDLATLESSCETLPFMGDVRLVIWRECPLASAQARGAADQQLTKDVCDYVARLPDHVILLIFVRGNADKRKQLVQLIYGMNAAVDFPVLSEPEVISWCTKYCADFGKKIEIAAAKKLIEFSGRLLQDIKDGLEKALSYIGDAEAVTVKDIEAIVAPSLEFRGYQMASSLLDLKEAEVMGMIKQLVIDGEKALPLLLNISRAVNQHLSVKLMTEGNVPVDSIAATLGFSPGAVRALSARARRLNIDALAAAIKLCNETDLAMKTTSLTEDMALSRLYIAVFSIIRLLRRSAA